MKVCKRYVLGVCSIAIVPTLLTEASAVSLQLPATPGSWIRQDNPDQSSDGTFGRNGLFVGSVGGDNALRGITVYDLSSFTPGDVINSATASLFHRLPGTSNHKAGDATTTDVSIHLSAETPTSDATWNNFDGVNPWATAGGDFGSPLATTVADVENINANEEVAFSSASLTAAIQSAVTAGDDFISFIYTAPQLEATGVRDFFAFAGDEPDAGELSPILSLDFSPQFDIADVNRDGVVSAADFFQISDDLFKTDAELTGVNVNSDIDGSGLVDFADFRIWKDTPQGSAVALTIPEPTSLLMLGTAASVVVSLRARLR